MALETTIRWISDAGDKLMTTTFEPFEGSKIRGAIRWWVAACGAGSLAVAISADVPMSTLWLVGLIVVSFGLVMGCTLPRRRFVAPSFLIIMLGTSYPLTLARLMLKGDDNPLIGWGSLGAFDFTNEAAGMVAWPLLSCFVGLLVGTIGAERIWRSIPDAPAKATSFECPGYLSIAGWVFLSVGLIATCSILGIGRTGILDNTTLPLKLNGVLVYARTYLLPALAAGLVQAAVASPKQSRLVACLVLLIVVAGIGSVAATSRGLVMYYVIPVFLFAATYQAYLGRPLRRFVAPVVACLFSMAVAGYITTTMRTTLFTGDGWMAASELAGDGVSSSLGKSLDTFLDLVSYRLSGLGDSLAILTSLGSHDDPRTTLAIFSGDVQVTTEVLRSALGFELRSPDGMAFGIGIPLLASAGLGGSFLVPFLTSVLLVIGGCLVEAVFSSCSERATGAVLGCLLIQRTWEIPTWFQLWRSIVMIAFIYLGIRVLPVLKRSRRA